MKRLLAALVCLAFLLPCSAVRAEPPAFAGGQGTADNPYLIENELQLRNVHLYPEACFLVTADITCIAAWQPIGTKSAPFTGCFDGGGHTVSGLRGSPSNSFGCQGLFGYNAGTVRNVHLADCSFFASAEGAYAGAIAAINSGTVEGCSASGQIEASAAAGGLVGKNEPSGILRRCYSSCTVISSGAAGGIAGISSRQIVNCYNTGSITGYTAGGITGQGQLPLCCYNVGAVSGTVFGGIAGEVPASHLSENDGSTCYFLDNVPVGTSNNAACVILSDTQMRLQDSYSGFDFDSVWYMGGSYPALRLKAPSKPITPEGIAITSLPDKTVYLEGESFCADGLTVAVCYSNGTRQTVTDYLVGGYEATPGEHIITVSRDGFTAAFAVTVHEIVPDTISSPVYAVTAGWLRKIPLCTTVASLTANLNESAFITVYNGQTKAHSSAYVRTGMTVAVLEGDTVKTSLAAVVTGDISSDGKLTTADLTAAKAHLLKSTGLTGAAAQAADCNGDGSVTLTDFLLLNAHILGKYTLQPN